MSEPLFQSVENDRRKGRAATSNPAGRFERYSSIEQNDGWDIPEDRALFRTQVRTEMSRSIITYNKSPDLPFGRSINPYRGCEHGCIYCFARPSHAYLGLSPGLDFETQLVARPMAADVLEKELRNRRYHPEPIAIGTSTDPYQPIEKAHKIMRSCLEVLSKYNHPVAITTKGTLVERDIDILAPMARKGLVRVGVSITTLDGQLSRAMEPRVPAPARRLAAIQKLSAAGIPVRIMVSPVVPALSDPELEAVMQAGRDAGADAASWIMLRLPREVSPLFQDWLAERYPNRAGRIMARLREMHGGKEYDAQWHRRMRGEGHYADLIAKRFDLAATRLGLNRETTRLRCDLFKVPARAGDQLSLF